MTKPGDDEKYEWVANERANPSAGSVAAMLVSRRNDIDVIGEITDDCACFSYDDWALCKLDSNYYLLSTSGCSCPSPSETWRVEIGPATLQAIRDHVTNGAYEGYTLPKKQESDFVELLDKAMAKG